MTDQAEAGNNPFQRAIAHIEKNFQVAGKPITRTQIMVVINCTHGWFYKCLKQGTTSVVTARKLEMLTGGAVTWEELCPDAAQEVRSVAARIQSLTA